MNTFIKKFHPAIMVCHDEQEKLRAMLLFFNALNIFDPSLKQAIASICEVRYLQKKVHLLFENENSEETFYVVKGGIKLYRKQHDQEHIAGLYADGDFCSISNPLAEEFTSPYNAVCTTDTLVVAINQRKLLTLARRNRQAMNLVKMQVGMTTQYFHDRMSSLQIQDATGRYESLSSKQSELLQYFKLADIAIYLGIQPETLSRIRSSYYKRAS